MYVSFSNSSTFKRTRNRTTIGSDWSQTRKELAGSESVGTSTNSSNTNLKVEFDVSLLLIMFLTFSS